MTINKKMKIMSLPITIEQYREFSDKELTDIVIKQAMLDSTIDTEGIDKVMERYNLGFITITQLYGEVIQSIADQFGGIIIYKFIDEVNFEDRIKKAKILEKMVQMYMNLKELDPVNEPNTLWDTAVQISRRQLYLQRIKEEHNGKK